MPATSVHGALRFIRALFTGCKAEGQSDQYLLEQFVLQRDEAAFVALLQRHASMVMGVCKRVLHDEHLAEDALQATFLVLALKARELTNRRCLAGWLYGTAMHMARKAKAQAGRFQRSIARESTEIMPDGAKELIYGEEQALLDDELQRLPEKYRLPLLLCYFEGLTREEAASQLGWPVGRVRGLLDRGRKQLRIRLKRRGVTLAAGGASLLLGSTLFAAVPGSLKGAIVQAALNVISGKSLTTCGASARVVALAKGGCIMSPKKIVLVLALVCFTSLIAISAGIWAGTGQVKTSQVGVAAENTVATEAQPPQEPPASSRPQPPEGDQQSKEIRPADAAQGGKPRVKWEYKTITGRNHPKTVDELNELGEQGWEVFAIISGQANQFASPNIYYLKRQK